MSEDRQAVLEKLRMELAFVESGGYRNPARAQWRPQLVFEDSPTCLNRDPTKPRRPCSECTLAEFIPEGLGKNCIPCRHIPLNENGETMDSFYRTGTEEEWEAAVTKWLRATIERLERESAQALSAQERPEIHVNAKFVSSAENSSTMFSRCANPDCGVPFDYGRGRFFRFHKSHAAGESAPNTHSVQHFWLCGHCCQELTLEYQDAVGVLIKNRPDVVCEAESARFIAAA